MRKVVLVLSIAGMLATGAAFAQSAEAGFFAGVSLGFESAAGLTAVPVGVHLGVQNLGVKNLEARADFAYWVSGYNVIEAGLDALYDYPVSSSASIYGGLGPRLAVLSGAGIVGFGLVVGGEYRFTPHIGVTAEMDANPYFVGGAAVAFVSLTAGANYHF
jgi:hypothetical protein